MSEFVPKSFEENGSDDSGNSIRNTKDKDVLGVRDRASKNRELQAK